LSETPKLLIGFIYIAKEILDYNQIAGAITKAIIKLNETRMKK
jgi:hypothetical protein